MTPHLKAWEANIKDHKRGLELIKPGVKCSDICHELNELFAELGYLHYRTFGYGHSFGVYCLTFMEEKQDLNYVKI